MTSGLPTRVAICAVLVTAQLVSVARADEPATLDPTQEGAPSLERRQVAVIDLSEDPSVAALSGRLYEAINQSDTLMIPNKRGLDQYLTGTMRIEDAIPISAKTYYQNAQAALDEGRPSEAVSAAASGLAQLKDVLPTDDETILYADLSQIAGLAQLDLGKTAEAARAFAVTHQFDPTRRLDPARYPPDVVATFKRVVTAKPAVVKLDVRGSGTVWIDGTERGPSPAVFEVEAGEHLVTIAGTERNTEGQIVIAPATVLFKDAPAPEGVRVHRARLALARAQAAADDVARAGAMKRLAAMLGVGDAVMISKRINGTLQWEIWRDRAPGFSPPHIYTNQSAEEILEGLGPLTRVRVRKQEPPQPFIRPPLVEAKFYEKDWFYLSTAGVVVGVIIGIVALSRINQRQTWDQNVQYGGDPSQSR